MITVVGAGAIGATVGAHLVRAGEHVRFVDADGDHVAAMRRDGLTIEGFQPTFSVQVEDALTPAELAAAGPVLDIVLLAVKAQHTRPALDGIADLLGPQSYVVSMQNGLCERDIAERIGAARTVGCLVNFAADYLKPGVISYGGLGTVRLGELDGTVSERVQALCSTLQAWGPVEVTHNIWGYLWAKLGYANMMFATAMSDAPAGQTIGDYRQLMVDLAAEVYEVADLEGVRPEPFDGIEPALYYPPATRSWPDINAAFDGFVERSRTNLKKRTGIWRDLAVRNRPTEVDEQVGRVVDLGRSHGLPMTLTTLVVRMIHELERGERERGRANLEELDAARAQREGSTA
jgi:2-dehydropantoate 2-reductase